MLLRCGELGVTAFWMGIDGDGVEVYVCCEKAVLAGDGMVSAASTTE
jgi:hypothetical protein